MLWRSRDEAKRLAATPQQHKRSISKPGAEKTLENS